MPAWIEQISANNFGTYGVAFIGVLVAFLLIILIFRLLFGRRLRMQGSRQRLARLGIVDAFSLDRQRQLVILRRDNVEHLILIGGPNDLLIESEIIRVEARDSRDQRLREKDPREKENKEAGVVSALSGAVRAPAAVPGFANLPPQAAENLSALASIDGRQPPPVEPPGLQIPAPPAISAATIPSVAIPEPSSRPLTAPAPRAIDVPAGVQQAQTTSNSNAARSESPTPSPPQQVTAQERKMPSSEIAPIPRPASSFTLPPRPNPFPIPQRRAPVTTPLPKTLTPPADAQPEQGAQNPSLPKSDAGTKIEPSVTPRPSFLRTPLSPSLARPLPRAGLLPPQAARLTEQQPEAPTSQVKEGVLNSDTEVKPLPAPLAASLEEPKNAASVALRPSPELEQPEEKSELTSPAPHNAGGTEVKPAEDPKQLVEAEADPLNSLEAEMAKLLGRE